MTRGPGLSACRALDWEDRGDRWRAGVAWNDKTRAEAAFDEAMRAIDAGLLGGEVRIKRADGGESVVLVYEPRGPRDDEWFGREAGGLPPSLLSLGGADFGRSGAPDAGGIGDAVEGAGIGAGDVVDELVEDLRRGGLDALRLFVTAARSGEAECGCPVCRARRNARDGDEDDEEGADSPDDGGTPVDNVDYDGPTMEMSDGSERAPLGPMEGRDLGEHLAAIESRLLDAEEAAYRARADTKDEGAALTLQARVAELEEHDEEAAEAVEGLAGVVERLDARLSEIERAADRRGGGAL